MLCVNMPWLASKHACGSCFIGEYLGKVTVQLCEIAYNQLCTMRAKDV